MVYLEFSYVIDTEKLFERILVLKYKSKYKLFDELPIYGIRGLTFGQKALRETVCLYFSALYQRRLFMSTKPPPSNKPPASNKLPLSNKPSI